MKAEWLNYDFGAATLVGSDRRFPTQITFATRLSGNVYRIGGDFKF